MPRVTFLPDGPTVDAEDGESLFAIARAAGVAVNTACVGQGTCGLCRMRVVEGEAALSPYSDVEERHLGNVYHLTRVRLSCQARVSGDVSVEMVVRRRKKR